MTVLTMRPNTETEKRLQQPVRLLTQEQKTRSMYLRLYDITLQSFSGLQRPSEETFATRYLNGDVFVKEFGNAVVGYALLARWENRLHIISIATDPSFRGLGVARQILDAVAAHAREMKKPAVTLSCKVDNPAQKLYYDCGFRVTFVAKGYYDEEGDGLMMRMEIGEKHVQEL